MRKIVVLESLTLDGVMQAPGRADEDLRGGFEHGGWALPYRDSVMGSVMAQGMADIGPLLFGRRTYEDFFKVWPGRKDNPYSEVLDNAPKLVASRTWTGPLPWKNSTLVKGEAASAVARMKAEAGQDILVMGSGELVRSLMRDGLVDLYMLLIHPLVLGSGRRLFPEDGSRATLQVVDEKTTTTGVLMATYRPTEEAAPRYDAAADVEERS